MRSFLTCLAVFVALNAILIAPGWATDSAAEAREAIRPVKLITVAHAPETLVRQFYGQVVARQSVDLAFQVGGQILKFPVIEGDTIPKGGLVAELDLDPFIRALETAKLQLDQSERTRDRLRRLKGSAVSQVQIDDAETAAELARLSVRNAEVALSHATLSAPFDALVATRNVANFTTIAAGSPVARLHDMSELRIEIDVPEVLFQTAGEDPDVEITARFPSSPRSFPLQVREFNAETSSVGQTFRLTFGMEPPEGLRILPGASVTVLAKLKIGAGGMMVPPSAVASAPDGTMSVMVFTPDSEGSDTGTVASQTVNVDVIADGRIQLRDGVKDGAEIVAAGIAGLRDGQAVRRFSGFTN